MNRIVVVGASLAGWNAARAIRKEGFDGSITMIGAEPHRPYDRPPLSKGYLAGKEDESILNLPGFADADALGLDWCLGRAAAGLDLARRTVSLDDGEPIPFDGLVIATGGAVRRLEPDPGLAGVHVLRTVDDSRALRDDLDAHPGRVLVVGAGFIGAEVAATCRERGLDVTMVEVLAVPLERALGPMVGGACAEVHRDHGVQLCLGVGVERLEGGQRVERVILTDGRVVDVDVVVVGVGVRPATNWLIDSGLRLSDGVVCDATCRAAPGVVAAGDVARWPNSTFGGEVMRVEHWDNAIDMGGFAGRRLVAGDAWDPSTTYGPVPWFWSDQYDRKLQLAGRVHPDDEVRIADGSIEERRFAAIYGRGGRVVGVFGMNRPRQVMTYRALIARGATWDEALAASGG